MTEIQKLDYHAVRPDYDQDWINGISQDDYDALFKELNVRLNNNSNKKVLDLAGGSGKLTRMLREKYDAYLFEHVKNLVEQAIVNGLPREKTFVANILDCDYLETIKESGKFDAVIIKSSTHEFPESKIVDVYKQAFSFLNDGGFIMDWDVHEPNYEISSWIKKWVNLKDEIAGLTTLVENRYFYTEEERINKMKEAGFKSPHVVYRFSYNWSVRRLGEVYWNSDEQKTKFFYEETKKLLESVPSEITVEISSDDIKLKAPAVIIVAEK